MKNLSKQLSYILRHRPESSGIVLDENSYASVSDLIEKFNNDCIKIDFLDLEAIVVNDAKNRYDFNEDKTKIRANYGHSFPVDLGLSRSSPPETLYHGTSRNSENKIMKEGIKKRKRNYVHLSCDYESAFSVGARHGEPIVLKVDARKMEKDGYVFYHFATVWLTEYVPPKYIERTKEEKINRNFKK